MQYRSFAVFVPIALAGLPSCASPSLRMTTASDWRRYVIDRSDAGTLSALRLRPETCEGYDLKPEYATLNEGSLVRFLQKQQLDVEVQTQMVEAKHPELHYVFVNVPGANGPVSLRVAVLPSADEAGRALHEGVLARGPGAWGVHRGNVAVLGPNGTTADDIAFVAATKVACWGTLSIAGTDDDFVVPGGYMEP